MKFLADMGISPRTVNWLKSFGYDAVHLLEEGLERLPDDEILVKARLEGRILLTVDLDFGYLLAVSRATLPSAILFRLANKSYEIINERLAEALNRFEPNLTAGAIIALPIQMRYKIISHCVGARQCRALRVYLTRARNAVFL